MPTLGYWSLRGLGQPIRLLLAHTGTEYEEVFYEFGGAPDFDRSGWLNVKFTLGLDFPNLPYYVDGNIKVTESNAIARYIGRKNGLDGKTDEEKVAVDMVENLSYNFHIEFAKICYGPNFEETSKTYAASLKEKLEGFSKFLGGKKFFASDDVTFVDFHMYEILDVLKIFSPESFESFPNLVEYLARVESLPNVKAYMESPKFIKAPIFAKAAHWGAH